MEKPASTSIYTLAAVHAEKGGKEKAMAKLG
jgi:hypothetical protein